MRAKCFFSCINVFKAIISRTVLSSCIILTSWRAATVTKGNPEATKGPTTDDGSFDPEFLMTWLPCMGIILFIPELFLSMIVNKGHEFKWWWPSIAIFLACNIPNIWVIELDIQRRVHNETEWEKETLAKIGGVFTLPIYFTPPNWARLLEQISFLVLIFVKWMSPKGLTSHEKLSQLLLWFIGLASDILDLMDNLHDELVTYSYLIVYLVLMCYTTSHFQFSFNYTAKRRYRLRWTSDESDLNGFIKFKRRCKYLCCCCFESELWVMFTTIISMDGMFFALRLYLFFGLKVVTFGNIFFGTKNGIVVAIDIYRIISICYRNRKRSKNSLDEQRITQHEEDEEEEEEADQADIDEDRVVDMHLVIESDGVISASARTLRKETAGSSVLVRKKKSWELNAVVPQWAKRMKKAKNQKVVPGAELFLVYELEFAFDSPGENIDERIFRSIKDINIKDTLNPTANKSNRVWSGNKVHPSNDIDEVEEQES